jgi:hypothetical protein
MKGHNMQTRNDLPYCLDHMRAEVLMALDAPTAREELRHRRQADKYMAKAIRLIREKPLTGGYRSAI